MTLVDTVTKRFGEIVALPKNENFHQAEVSAAYGLRPPFSNYKSGRLCRVVTHSAIEMD